MNKQIQNFDFAEGEFEKLPRSIFQIDPRTLSPMESAILDGIKFQMLVSKTNNMMQYVNYHSIIRSISFGVTFTIIGFFIISLTYYANVNLNLGMSFLTEFFA